MAAILAGGCSPKVRYLTQGRTVLRTDTVYERVASGDTLHIIERVYESDNRFDSVAPILDSLNRVIGWDRYHFRERTKLNSRELKRLHSVIDSLRQCSADTICEKTPVPYPVERKLTRWEQAKMDFGGMAIGALGAVVVAAVVVWLVKRKRRK